VLLPFAFVGPVACQPVSEFVEGECHSGTLDRRYCDRSGDLVADPPLDSSRWLDPETLIFAYTPVEDPAQYRAAWEGFLDHMRALTGRKVQFFPVQSNAAQIEAMRAGRLHVAGFSTGAVPLAVNCAGFRPMAMMAGEDGSYGYEMEIITHVNSGIENIEGLRDRTLAFTSPTSNSGFKAPVILLRSEFGLEPVRDYKPAYSGGHDNSVLGVLYEDYDVAAVANEVSNRLFDQGRVPREKIRTLYKSQTFPTTGFGVSHNLHPELAARVREAFLTFPWEGSELAKAFEKEAGFIPISYQEHWPVIRQIDAALEITYSCR
jgi:phosphonate transport system substrate-binding protein